MKPLYKFLKTCMRYADEWVILDSDFIKKAIEEKSSISFVNYCQQKLPTMHSEKLINDIVDQDTINKIDAALNKILINDDTLNSPMYSNNALIWIINAGVTYYANLSENSEI